MLYKFVLKVCSFTRQSFCNKNELSLDYKIGKVTFPTVGKIFVLDTVGHVTSFLEEHIILSRVFLGIGSNITKPKVNIVPKANHMVAKQVFWLCYPTLEAEEIYHILDVFPTENVPYGTLFCDSFLPLADFTYGTFREQKPLEKDLLKRFEKTILKNYPDINLEEL